MLKQGKGQGGAPAKKKKGGSGPDPEGRPQAGERGELISWRGGGKKISWEMVFQYGKRERFSHMRGKKGSVNRSKTYMNENSRKGVRALNKKEGKRNKTC